MVTLVKVLLWCLLGVNVAGIIIAVAIMVDKNRDSTKPAERWVKKLAVSGLLFLIVTAVFSVSAGQITAGQRGVVLKLGAVTGRTVSPGLYFITPFINTVEVMDVQTHAFSEKASAASKDLQDVTTTVTLNFSLDPDNVAYVFENLRRDYIKRIIEPSVQETVKASTARFNAEELITRRPEVKQTIEENLRDRLEQHGILTDTISITNFEFSPVFTQSIEAKVVAVQKALEAQNKLEQIKYEAQQAKEKATGEANAAIAQAEGQKRSAILSSEGQAQAILTVADAQAEANEIVNKTLTGQIIQYSLVQKLGPDIKVVILPSGQQFILGPEILGK